MVLLASAPRNGLAQDETKAAFDPKKATEGGLGMPTPYDKFIALDEALSKKKIDWGQTFRKVGVDVDPDDFSDKDVIIPMVLGIRIADGVMAIKARDAELLNQAAADIEKLAQKLGISEGELSRARAVRAAANKGEWLKVFMELGFLQQDIMKKIETKENTSKGTLLIVGGWMQGARYTATIVEENYAPEISNFLREPLLARALKDKVASLPTPAKDAAVVGQLRETLPKVEKILDVPLTGAITKEQVVELKTIATGIVKAVLTKG